MYNGKVRTQIQFSFSLQLDYYGSTERWEITLPDHTTNTRYCSDFLHLLGPLSAQNVTITHVTPTEIFLHWNPPDLVSFHHYLVTILDVENNKSEEVLVEKLNTSMKIRDLKSFHHYLIYLFSVAERGTLSCSERPISGVTGKHRAILPFNKNVNFIFWNLFAEI